MKIFQCSLRALCVSAVFLSVQSASHASERLALEVRETAGIRRFGYPVAAELKHPAAVPATTNYRLLQNDKPIAAQFRPIEREGDRVKTVALDFDASFLPNESREYIVEFGPDVPAGSEPDRGMKVDETDESFVVSHGPNLTWTIPKDLRGLLRSVKTPKTDYMRPDSAGLFIRTADDTLVRVGDAARNDPPLSARIVKQGPIDCMLRFDGNVALRDNRVVPSVVELEFPRSKSWVRATWTVDDSDSDVAKLGADLNLNLTGEPTMVDFGAGSLVYATLARGQAVRLRAGLGPVITISGRELPQKPFWHVHRGPTGMLEPYAFSPNPNSHYAEGWAHVMDRERCTAVALAEFARHSYDQFEVAADGRFQLWRDFVVKDKKPRAGPKSLTFWIHFVPFPPHVGAVTSPQSMQSPLQVMWQTGSDKPDQETTGACGDGADEKHVQPRRHRGRDARKTRAAAALTTHKSAGLALARGLRLDELPGDLARH